MNDPAKYGIEFSVGVLGGLSAAQLLLKLPAAVYATDTAGTIIFFNEAAETFWGRTPVLGQDKWCGSFKLYRPDGTPLPLDECPMAVSIQKQTEEVGGEAVAERPDGSRIPFMAFPRLLHDALGSWIGALNVLVDTSAQKQKEVVSQTLAAIVDSSDDAIISKDLKGVVKTWNNGAEKLFGYPAEEMIGASIMKIIPPDRLDEEPRILGRIIAGQKIDHFETVRVAKDGTLREISLSVSPVRNQQGIVIGASKIARDISDRKESEKRIRSLLQEVNHRVKNQYQVILAMIRETNRRTQNVNDFEERLRERIMALASSHDLLVKDEWKGAELSELLLAQLEPFGSDRITLSGQRILLQPNAVQHLGIAFHELVSNSVKFGALSTDGTVRVIWDVETDKTGQSDFVLRWVEQGTSPIADVGTKGFGRVILEKVAPLSLNGHAVLDFAEAGICWELRAPLSAVRIGPDGSTL